MRTLQSACVVFLLSCVCFAQTGASAVNPQVFVPRLIRFNGQLAGQTGTVGVTFTLYRSQTDTAGLWTETQNITIGVDGKYSALVGVTKAEGIPVELFTSGEAQWLGVRIEGKTELSRVLLVSVPYAMKAAEADTLAGHPASEFVTADKVNTLVQQQLHAPGSVPSIHNSTAKQSAPTTPTPQGPTQFAGNTTDNIVSVVQSGGGTGLTAIAPGTAVYGTSTNTTGNAYGVKGASASSSGFGIYGLNTASAGSAVGIYGQSGSNAGVALSGLETSTTGVTKGVVATVNSPSGIAAVFQNTATGGKLFSGQAGPSHTEVFSVDGAGNATLSGNLGASGTITGNGSGLTSLNANNFASGVVSIGFGGTGISSSPSSAGQYLRSSGAGTWSVSPLEAVDIPTGQVVKSLNGQTDAVTIANGGQINVLASGGIITLSANATQLGTANTLVLRGGGGDINAGSIGAYAISSGEPGLAASGGPDTGSGGGDGVEGSAGASVTASPGRGGVFTGGSASSTFAGGAGVYALGGAGGVGTAGGAGIYAVGGAAGSGGSVQGLAGYFIGNTQISTNSAGNPVTIGNLGCNPGFIGIWIATSTGCSNYTLISDGNDTIINRPSGSTITFREGNSTSQMILNTGGTLTLNTLGSSGSTALCQNSKNQISTCSSSLQYKKDVQDFRAGMELIQKLRPVTFFWKDGGNGGRQDLGLVAEEVNQVDSHLVSYNEKGSVEGVKYDRVGVLLINAVKEQQELLQKQTTEIEDLKSIVCLDHPTATMCQPANVQGKATGESVADAGSPTPGPPAW